MRGCPRRIILHCLTCPEPAAAPPQDERSSRNESIRALRLKYSDAIKILHAVDIDADTRVIVFGDPEMGSYEWGIEVKGKVEQHSNAGYGNLPGALRDGLMTAWPPMDDGLTPGCAKPSEIGQTDAAPQAKGNTPAEHGPEVSGSPVGAAPSTRSAEALPFQGFDCHYDGDINACDKDCKQLGECKRRTTGIKPSSTALKFEPHCPDGSKCAQTTTGCQVGQCSREHHGRLALPPEANELAGAMRDARRYAARRKMVYEARMRYQISGPRQSFEEFCKEYDAECDKEAGTPPLRSVPSASGEYRG